MKRFVFILFTVVSFYALGQDAAIKGYIFDRRTNEAIPFCNIVIKELNYTATSDIDGHFKFEKVPFGKYKVKAQYIGMGDTTVEINITDKSTFDLKMELPPPCKYDKNLKDNTCPTCHKKDKVIPIKYGLIIAVEGRENDAYETYYPGGCRVSACDPNWYCKRDKAQF